MTGLLALMPGITHENEHVYTAGIATGVLILVAIYGRLVLGRGEAAIVPSGRFSIRGIFEILTEYIDDLSRTVIGVDGPKFVPLFASTFAFVLLQNLFGIIPGLTPATENINTTLAMGIFIFITYNFMGIKANGMAYLKHFLGPIIWLAPLMVVIELISHMVRPLSLGLRLANVMRGDHTVLGIFLDIAPIGLPIPFYLLGIFVCFVQAFVFTLLSMVYVALATAHDH